ncbi:hypothetical protein J1605_004324 [Eschrichtius robustus]|uniref:BMERB domain-containing protein n=1 Tax=Eschrichtius robustus TaxID=9764 RepID=A0AB34HJS7_ESCRO|nr:hypothetical protein J1605_004324 [Eschrichtius robustus]
MGASPVDLRVPPGLWSSCQAEGLGPRTYTEEELNTKLTRRVQRAARRQAKQEELKRLHRAQIIQRQLEQVEEKQRQLEERGVAVEKALRGEAAFPREDSDWNGAGCAQGTITELLVQATPPPTRPTGSGDSGSPGRAPALRALTRPPRSSLTAWMEQPCNSGNGDPRALPSLLSLLAEDARRTLDPQIPPAKVERGHSSRKCPCAPQGSEVQMRTQR